MEHMYMILYLWSGVALSAGVGGFIDGIAAFTPEKKTLIVFFFIILITIRFWFISIRRKKPKNKKVNYSRREFTKTYSKICTRHEDTDIPSGFGGLGGLGGYGAIKAPKDKGEKPVDGD